MDGRNRYITQAFGPELTKKINFSKVLVVGAGGIGCELLKNLVLSGFLNLEVIDLDTIDVSNLNRQFLFRPHHVGRPKAHVAKEAALAFNPDAKIVSHHANIKEPRFGVHYFSGFDLVINALDNVSARKHVNRLCLSADRPLIEAGTQGYLGQSSVIKKGETECFECTPQAPQKKFPICTIRSTPDKPVHCVVWAKEFHKLLFGDSRSSYLYEDRLIGADGDKEATGKTESVYMHEVTAAPTGDSVPSETEVRQWARRLFDCVFHDEIIKRLIIAPETYKTAAHPPKPVALNLIESGELKIGEITVEGGLKDQRVLSLLESATLLIDTIVTYFTDPTVRASIGSLEFSKDSPLDLDFVTAATNVRAFTFSIPMQSRFDVKSIAGNIIPAIATTNAIVAGLQVLEAIKILRGDDIKKSCAFTWISRSYAGGNRLLLPTKHNTPSSNCFVCGRRGVTLFIDTHETALGDFIAKVLKGTLSFNLPNIDNNESFNFIEERDEDEDDQEFEQKMSFLAVPIHDLVGGGIKDGMIIEITDFSQDASVSKFTPEAVIPIRCPSPVAEHIPVSTLQFFELVGAVMASEVAKKLDEEKTALSVRTEAEPAPQVEVSVAGQKRKRDATAPEIVESDAKKARSDQIAETPLHTSSSTEADVIELD